MNSKKWVIIVVSVPIVLIGICLILIKTFDRPWRFSDSISYDVKLNYIQNDKLMKNADAIVVGSSMALNNINGIELEDKSRKIKKVANLSSWGLQASEVLQFIKLIELGNIKYLIYPSQYFDFQKFVLKDIDENEVKKYLNNKFTLYPYTRTIKSLIKNLSNNIKYKSLYFNPNKYSYLNYDRTGSINFIFGSEFIKKSRWESQDNKEYRLSAQSFKDLTKLSEICKIHNIKFIVITTPMRKSILHGNRNLLNIFNKYTSQLKKLSITDKFIYLNTHNILKLTDNYFVDRTHLNKSGATLVSKEVIKIIN